MKIAHLILAHKNPQQLLRMVNALDHLSFDFYIHIDKKADLDKFTRVIRGENIVFIKTRVAVYWGGWGTIQAIINGFQEISGKEYKYINVISGQDFPLQSPQQIYSFLLRQNGKEYITCNDLEGDWADSVSRVRDYHLINWRIPGKFRLEKLVSKFLPKRRFPFPYQFVGGANWFTLTEAAVNYFLEFIKTNKAVVRYFKYCWGADEFIFSTILYNSPFRHKIRESLTYVDWNSGSKGHPKVLSMQDIDKLKTSKKLFARKFDIETDAFIIEELENWLKGGAKSVAEFRQA